MLSLVAKCEVGRLAFSKQAVAHLSDVSPLFIAVIEWKHGDALIVYFQSDSRICFLQQKHPESCHFIGFKNGRGDSRLLVSERKAPAMQV